MSILRDELISFLDSYLSVSSGHDPALNGLQVVGKAQVQRVALGVSANLDLFAAAARWGADLVLVHHGLIWRDEPQPIDFLMKKRLKLLFDHDITLLAYHLPLDAHAEVGNNIQISTRLGLELVEDHVAFYSGWPIGIIGQTKRRMPLTELVAQVNALFNTSSTVFPFGPENVQKVAILSGGGASDVLEAVRKGCDVYLTGEAKEPTPALCRESGITYIAAGHYNTEKFGVQALGELLRQQFGLEVQFFDVPNPL